MHHRALGAAPWLVPLLLALSSVAPARAASLTPQPSAESPRIDGWLDEALWRDAPLADAFVQQRPDEGQAASAATEVRIAYTSHALYIGFRCEEPREVFHKALGRDAWLSADDYFVVVLDPFLDRQNGVFFQVNPNGARTDEEFRAEGGLRNRDWDGIWSAAARITENGWQGEIEIPWRTLRFPNADVVDMGINFERQRRVVNEQSHWAPVPRQFSVFRVSAAGELTGLRDIRSSRNTQFRPYVLSRAERGRSDERGSFDREDWDGSVEIGGDVKVSVTSNYTIDLTVNTDFAEVEVDDELVNLTRFPLLFPEKREFFLEKANLFDFGSPYNRMFYSRSVGLRGLGEVVPIDYGARLTGKTGETEVGALFLRERGLTDRRFGVLRLKQDVGQRSNVGVMMVTRNSDGESFHRSFGVDTDLNPTDELLVSLYGSVTDDEGPSKDSQTWGGRARWSHRLAVLTLLHESLGSNYRPVVGFAPRREIDDTAVGWEFTPEPNWPWIRRFENQGFVEWIRRRHVDLESRYVHVNPVIVGPSEQRLSFFWERDFERLFEEFEPEDQSAVTFPVGEYTFDYFGFSLESDPSLSLNGSVETEFGEFFDGDKTTLRVNGRLRSAPHWTLQLTYEANHIERETGAGVLQEFDINVLRTRLAWDLNNQFGVKLFTQFNGARSTVLSQMRAHWIFGDESDVYFVVTDQREDGTRNYAPRRGEWVLKLGYARAW
jgi:Domain of unknown function (DUF5916)